MITLLIAIIIITAIFAIFEEYLEPYKKYIYAALAIILIATATFRPVGFDNDSTNYEYFFTHNDDKSLTFAVEFSFLQISRILRFFVDNVHIIFLFYAILGVSLKFEAIRRLSPILFLPVVIYLGNYFILHEMTQIRAGVASGLLLLSIPYLAERKWKQTLTCWFIALFFHYSSAALFLLVFLNNKDISNKWKIILASIIPIGYILYFLGVNVITTLPIPYIGNKIEAYQDLKAKGIIGDEINVFNAVFLVKEAIFLYLLYMYDTVKQFNKYLPLMLRIMALSIFSFLIFAPLPVLAFRISELYGIVDIILFTNIYYTIRPSILSKIIVCIIGFSLFAINVFYAKLLDLSF